MSFSILPLIVWGLAAGLIFGVGTGIFISSQRRVSFSKWVSASVLTSIAAHFIYGSIMKYLKILPDPVYYWDLWAWAATFLAGAAGSLLLSAFFSKLVKPVTSRQLLLSTVLGGIFASASNGSWQGAALFLNPYVCWQAGMGLMIGWFLNSKDPAPADTSDQA